MFETLTRLYDGGKGKLTKDGLKKAVGKGWIAAADYKTICGEDYPAAEDGAGGTT